MLFREMKKNVKTLRIFVVLAVLRTTRGERNRKLLEDSRREKISINKTE